MKDNEQGAISCTRREAVRIGARTRLSTLVAVLILLAGGSGQVLAADFYVGGAGASDNNPGTANAPFATIQKAATVAVAGSTVKIRTGTYRETIIPSNSGSSGNPITFEPDGNAVVTVSGADTADGGWTVYRGDPGRQRPGHYGKVYQKTISLPVTGYRDAITGNETLLANQVFVNGKMMIEARWPNTSNSDDLMNRDDYRMIPQGGWTSENPNKLFDNSIPDIPGGWTGGTMWAIGWYAAKTNPITASSTGQISFSGGFHRLDLRGAFYYLTGRLGALDTRKEWFYDGTKLYLWAPDDGTPNNVEVNMRNYAFDLSSGKSYITIRNINVFAATIITDSGSESITLDGLRVQYNSHFVTLPSAHNSHFNVSGIRLMGPNSVIRNSIIEYSAGHGIALGGDGCVAENNLIHDISYGGTYCCGIYPAPGNARNTITHNTIFRTGRSGIDGIYANKEIAYNDIYEFGLINTDLGAIYSARSKVLTGTHIHHNWLHDAGNDEYHSFSVGAGIYLDQDTRPATIHHNVFWNNHENDIRTHQKELPGNEIYNNTLTSTEMCYTTQQGGYDPANNQNNIYRSPGNKHHIPQASDITYETDPLFLGEGEGGLAYRLKAGSPAIDHGIVIRGITGDYQGSAPDAGAYEYGGEEWVPGCNLQPTVGLIGWWKLDEKGVEPLHVTYEIPREAAVSLGLFDNQGRLLRHLIKGETRAAGVNHEFWDGLDQWGNVIQAGQYQLKGAYFDPLRLEYVMTATNPGDPPWWTADGTGGWLSDEAAPQDVVTDGTNVYIAAPNDEAGNAIITVGPDGKRIWGAARPSGGHPRAVSLALLGDRLYAMYSGPGLTGGARSFKPGDKHAIGQAIIMCFDKHSGTLAGPSVISGRPIRFTTWEYRHDIHALWDLRLNQRFSPATYGGQHRYYNTEMCETTNALGLTAVGDRLVASMFYDNELMVLDPDSLEILKRIPLEAPAGLHGLDANSLLAVSGTRVVRVDITTGAITPLIDRGLSAPFGVTTDRDGTIYVSDWGDSFQVKAFDARGSLLRAIGKAGGRPWVGLWEAEGMAVPRGIAVTDDQRLWVAEDEFSPRRVSVWNAATGVLIRDYIGPANYKGWNLAFDPLNPRRIITTGTEFMLDFENKTYTPTRKMFLRRSRDDAFMPNNNGMAQSSRIIYREGREFYVEGRGGWLTILERRGDEYRAVAGVSKLERTTTIDGTQRSVWDSDLGSHMLPDWYPEFFKGQAGNNHIWNDLNGDGIMQENEVAWDNTLRRGDSFQPGRMGEWGPSWAPGFGPDWEIYLSGRCGDAWEIYRLDPEFTDDGLPRYSFDRARTIIHHRITSDYAFIDNLYASSNGKLYVTYSDRGRGDVKNGIVCYDRDGNELWGITLPRDSGLESLSESAYGYPNAEFHYPDLGSGVVTWEWRRRKGRVYLLSDDGLYLGGLLDIYGDLEFSFRQARGNEVSKFAFQKPDGRLYMVNGSDASAHHIHEIQGLETAKRFELPLIISEQDAIAAARAMEIEAPFEAGQPAILVGRTNATPLMDVELTGWDFKTEGVCLSTDHSSRGGQFALKTDGTNLFFAARIQDETPMVNNGESWLMPFMTGDCVDLMLAINPEADPGRRSAAPGDLRLLFTELRGEPIAVLYRQSLPGTTNPVLMMATTIDDVRRLPEATPVIHRHTDGYTLTATIPLASLGLSTLPLELRGDIGIIYGDGSGRNRDQRLYCYNKHTELISDLTREARLYPDKWGRIVLATPGNLIGNAGFEAELGETILGNWQVSAARNGATAQLTTKSVFAGGRSLLLKQSIPVKLPENAANISDQSEYMRQLNDGAGGGEVQVIQRVPVEGGRRYDLRLAYRAHNLVPEIKSERHGYAIFWVFISWIDSNGRHILRERALRAEHDQSMWKQVLNDRANWPIASGEPFVAPRNATQAEIQLQLTVNFDSQPEVFIDQIEFTPIRQ